jgi:DMSO/TMAO reductase YedYZ molybdopterin-dependent catalytic subunit
VRHELTDQGVYEETRTDQYLWQRAKAMGLTRRQVLKLMAAGAGAAALGFPGPTRQAGANHVQVVKPTPADRFVNHGSNRETLWSAMADEGYLTPNELFFVRNHTRTPHIDPATWRLRVEGSGVGRPLELTYDELVGLGSQSETKFIECAGNGRRFFRDQQGTVASGTQWSLGAIGVAEWTGVRLSTVLELAELKGTAVDVMPEGLDNPVSGEQVRRPMSIEKALEDDTLLVYAMNGEALPEDHGFPVRALVPGWIGIANIKWVGRIEVSEAPLFSPWNTTSYRLFGAAYPDQPVLTTQAVKSAFELDRGATLPAGPNRLTGRSWSAFGKIAQVEVSVDGGLTWRLADLDHRNIPKAWVRWELVWDAAPGNHVLMARATDKHGHVQPDAVPHNDQGYLFWAVVEHPVTVA